MLKIFNKNFQRAFLDHVQSFSCTICDGFIDLSFHMTNEQISVLKVGIYSADVYFFKSFCKVAGEITRHERFAGVILAVIHSCGIPEKYLKNFW